MTMKNYLFIFASLLSCLSYVVAPGKAKNHRRRNQQRKWINGLTRIIHEI